MINKLFEQDLQVINIGLSSFADAINQTGGKSLQLDWRPPAMGDKDTGVSLSKLVNQPEVEAANRIAFERFMSAQPVLTGVGQARDVIPNFGERTLLHAGPPIEWSRMCGPMQGAIIGAILFEGWAGDQDAARELASSGKITFAPCHHLGAVGPMSGVISPSMPVWIVKNLDRGNMSFSNLNEGLGKVLRFGANDASVLERLKWMAEVLGPAMNAAVQQLGGIELRPIIAQALHMGDECHNRNAAASSILFKKLTPALLKTDLSQADITKVLEFIAGNDHFFLNISMTCCKSMLDAGHGVEHSTLVTAMARNGVDFGIRMSGTGDAWFIAPAPMVDGLFFPGYSQADAAPDLGDSAITETAGIGGFAMGAAPAIVQFVGGTPQDAIAFTREMLHITLGVHGGFTLPPLNFTGSPAGIDARKVVDTGIAPVINTGIAHKDAGVGQVGAGITRAPLECFTQAVNSIAKLF
jgi:hypothetical protein